MAKTNLHFEMGGLGKVSPAIVNGRTVADFPEVGDFTHLYVETSTNLLYRWNGSGYVPLGDSSKVFLHAGGTAYEVGGIALGTDLYGKTYEQILNLMLYKASYPTLTDPSVSVELDRYLYSLNSTATITGKVTFNRGSIEPAYGTSGLRAGKPNKYYLNGTTIASQDLSMPFSVTIDNIKEENDLTFWVQYDGGEQPMDSDGNAYDLALPAGKISNITTVRGLVPVFKKLEGSEWTEESIETTVTADGRGFEVSMPTETSSDAKQTIAIDASVTIVGIKQYDDFRGVWAWIYDSPEESLEAFNVEESEVSDGKGNTYAVRIYSNALMQMGARKLRFYAVVPEEE